MNIGIVTIFGEWNYGNRLQNYALQTVIEFLGNTCSTIVVDQNGESDIHRRLAMPVCHAVKKNSYLRRKRCYNFYKFNEKYINQNHYTASSLPLVANDTFDYVVCGSDQVWNLKLGDIKSNPDLYFLSFIERKRRVSYAASIGTDFVPPEHRDYFVSKIKGIPSISVRENSARDIIKELTSRDVDVVIDPTLLLSQKQWSDLAQKPKNFTDKKYLATYFLGDTDGKTNDYIRKIAENHNLQIVPLLPDYTDLGGDISTYTYSPSEFLYVLQNAEFVATDSFHGSVFSIIFEKPFRWFARKSKTVKSEEKMSDRTNTLFSTLGIDSWCVADFNESVDGVMTADYSQTPALLSKERAKAIRFLNNALSQDK